MKKITTINGTEYHIDEENKKIKRVPSTKNIMSYDGEWVDYFAIFGIQKDNISSDQNSQVVKGHDIKVSGYYYEGVIEIGHHLYVNYGTGKDMPWCLSTEIVSIGDVDEKD